MRSSLFVLNNLDVNSPCFVSSSNLISNNNGEWCKACSKQVYDTVKHTRLDMAHLLFSERGNVCVRIERDSEKNIIYKTGLVKSVLSNLLYLSKFVLPSSFFLFDTTVLAQESYSIESSKMTGEILDRSVTYGDVRIPDSTANILAFIEGAFGALLMASFFFLFLITLTLSFFQREKSKKKRKIIWAVIFLFLSIVVLAIRSLVVLFF